MGSSTKRLLGRGATGIEDRRQAEPLPWPNPRPPSRACWAALLHPALLLRLMSWQSGQTSTNSCPSGEYLTVRSPTSRVRSQIAQVVVAMLRVWRTAADYGAHLLRPDC